MQFDFGGDAQPARSSQVGGLFEIAHGLFEHFGVEREADLYHFADCRAEDFACAADFQILHGEGETCDEFVCRRDGVEAFFCVFGDVFRA